MTDSQPARVALVTGAAGGIGQATVSRLRARGYAIIAEDISPEVAELGADEAIVPLQADVSLSGTAQRAVALAQERFGRLDLLVNNAGLFLRKPTEECTDEDFDVLMAVNVRGAFSHARESLAALAATKGSIVNLASISGLVGQPNQTIYSMTKGALVQLTRQLAVEHAHRGIRVNAVAPGAVDTDFIARARDAAADPGLRHLLHHTAAMPDAQVDAIVGGDADRTTAAVLSALAQVPALAGRPGIAYAYGGAGYVCLAAAAERAAGQPLPEFAAQRIFIPLGMSGTCFWPGPAPAPPGAAPLAAAHPAPLSLGDGGVWSTARDLLRWSQALNADELGISPLMQTPGGLDDGTPVGYAWGMGVRSHAGYRVYRHGGGWPGLRALLARVPDLNQSLVIIALADNSERRTGLAASMLDLVTALPSG